MNYATSQDAFSTSLGCVDALINDCRLDAAFATLLNSLAIAASSDMQLNTEHAHKIDAIRTKIEGTWPSVFNQAKIHSISVGAKVEVKEGLYQGEKLYVTLLDRKNNFTPVYWLSYKEHVPSINMVNPAASGLIGEFIEEDLKIV